MHLQYKQASFGGETRGTQQAGYLFGVGEAVYQLDLFHKVTSNVPDLLTQVVLCEGPI